MLRVWQYPRVPSALSIVVRVNEDQWSPTKRYCDYYIVIVGYAIEQGKPIIGFLHQNPGALPANRCESEPAA